MDLDEFIRSKKYSELLEISPEFLGHRPPSFYYQEDNVDKYYVSSLDYPIRMDDAYLLKQTLDDLVDKADSGSNAPNFLKLHRLENDIREICNAIDKTREFGDQYNDAEKFVSLIKTK